MLLRQREYFRRARLPTSRDSLLGLQRRAAPGIGDTVSFRFQTWDCDTYEPVQARAVYAGRRAIVFEDLSAPLAGQIDAELQSLGAEFDTVMFDIVRQHFADPLAFDAQLDGDGRIRFLFTHKVNEMNGVMAFVSSCDFESISRWAASNEGEVVYANVPLSPRDISFWHRTARPTVIHEVKHIASYAARYAAGHADFEVSWLEEGMAMHAEELYGRRFTHAAQRTNAGYDSTLRCDYNEAALGCTGRPYLLAEQFTMLYRYWTGAAPLSLSPERASWPVYGASWSFLRAVADRVSISEDSLYRALMHAPEFGAANLEARTNISFEELFVDWLIASAVDDRPGVTPHRPEHTLPSWNSYDIFRGLRRAFYPPRYELEHPLDPAGLSFGSFRIPLFLQPASAMFYEVSGLQQAEQILGIVRADGGKLPPNTPLRIAIMRIE